MEPRVSVANKLVSDTIPSLGFKVEGRHDNNELGYSCVTYSHEGVWYEAQIYVLPAVLPAEPAEGK